jgi:hypothetical protein
VRDEAEHKADRAAVEVGARRCRDAEGVSEHLLEGGDVNVVVRIGETVCRPTGLEERGGGVERAPDQRRGGYELHRELRAEQRQPGWREMWDAGSGETILTGVRWLEENRAELERWL